MDKGDINKSIKAFNNARAEYIKEANWHSYWVSTQSVAIMYQETDRWDESAKVLKEAEGKIPVTPDNYPRLGMLQDNLGFYYLEMYQLDDAVKAYTASINFYEKAGAGHAADIAFEKVNRAVAYNYLAQFDKAAADMEAAIAFYSTDLETEPLTLAEHYRTLGANYNEMSAYDKAIQNFDIAHKLVARSNEQEFKAKVFNDLGIAYLAKDNFDLALQNLNSAKTINQSLFGKDADHYATNIINIGNAYEGMGDLETAMKLYQQALEIFNNTPPSQITDVTDLLMNISRITDDLGMTAQSKLIQEQALNLAIKEFGPNNLIEADIYTRMAATAFTNAEYDASLNFNFKALSLLQSNEYPLNEDYAIIYTNIGQAYDELFEIDLALQYKNQALELYRQIHGTQHPNIAMAIGNIGLSYEMNGENDKALEYLSKSLEMRLATQDPAHDDVGTTYLNIGFLHLKKLDYQPAKENLGQALAVYQGYNKNVTKAMIHNRLAVCYLMEKDLTKAALHYQKAIVANVLNFDNENPESSPVQPDFLGYYEMIISLVGKADIYTKKGDVASLSKAAAQLDAVDKILTEKALKLNNPKDRLELAQVNFFFTEAGMLLADQLFKATKNPAHLEKAFYYSERNKANELYADIQVSKAATLAKVPKKLSERRQEISARINTMEQQIADAYTAKNQQLITQLKAKQFDLSKEYEAIQTEINGVSPRYVAAAGQRSLPGWGDVKSHLDAKTALVSYVITDSAKYVLVGNQTKLILKQLPTAADLDRLVRAYRNQIKYKSPAFKKIGDQLTDLVWAPVEEAFKELGAIENVIIIPDGPLSYLPFEALGRGQFLLKKYNIRYQLSGAMMLNAGENRVRNKPSMIAMAPVFADEESSFLNKSCQRFVEATQKADTSTRAFSLNGEYITPLPATETEVQKIHQIHTDKDIFSRFFLKEAAREELIKKGELEQFDYIHLATHGIVNSQYPELSGLLLTQDPKSPEDGILYTGEIFGLNLKADLVTLSACETALGKKVEGEGVRGLTTAFLYAGAKSVVVSLWKVADESTAQLMIEFYTQLLAGNDKVTSLKAAKLKLLAGGTFQHPYYWAPFVQIGGN